MIHMKIQPIKLEVSTTIPRQQSRLKTASSETIPCPMSSTAHPNPASCIQRGTRLLVSVGPAPRKGNKLITMEGPYGVHEGFQAWNQLMRHFQVNGICHLLTWPDGTELAYLDSGPPSSATIYTTIFSVHGITFTSPVFQKVSELSCKAGIRFVAINRREYKGSTPYPDADKSILTEGTPAQKTEWLKNRGLEIFNFMNSFILRESLPAISAEGKGGSALFGWSMGCTFTSAAIAHIGDLPSAVKARLASHLRAHIMLEPPPIALGLPTPTTLLLSLGPAIPQEMKMRFITSWITSYFQHNGFATRDINGLDIVPSTIRVPSLWNMSAKECANMIDLGPSPTFDFPLLGGLPRQNHESYIAATFDSAVRDQLSHMKVWLLVGDASLPVSISALWSIQDDDNARGGGNVNYKILHDANHFVHWDEPKLIVDTFLEILS